MDPSRDQIPVFLRTNEEISATSAHGFLRDKENTTDVPPIHPLGGTAFLYHNPGRDGEN